ncbi:MAG TPA: methyltransferase domain-containing protein [Candidatus Limnocylindrales bacterium]|nr:methyltransferase domain-containing protein [Candidatus Limnocylindrales bacterium]HET9520746.1 methyltransferase domain-containing protein [Candidatus Limnocylindrales bacterium]
MDRLTATEEFLDGPLDDPATLAGNLRDLRRVNRLLGGVRLSRTAVDRLLASAGAANGAPVTMLDVGTGGADIPVALLADARRRGRRLDIVAVDARPEILAAATSIRPNLARTPGLTLAVSDGRSLPYPDAAFDIAHASLVLHHSADGDAVTLLREMARVARVGVVVNDLSRTRIHWLGAWLIANLLTRNAFTRHDGPLSVQRAYRPAEMRDLLHQAGLRPVAQVGGFVGHRYAIAAVHR